MAAMSYDISSRFTWDVDPDENIIILNKITSSTSMDVVINKLPDVIRVKPDNLITLNVSDLPHPGKGVVTTAGTAAVGTMLLGPIGLVMGAAAGAMTANKENQKDKKVYYKFRLDNDDTEYEYNGTIPTNLLFLLDGIVNNPDFGKNIGSQGSQTQIPDNTSVVNININPNDPEPTIKRIKLLLEDKKWPEAMQYCEAALDLFPENSWFYILQYCAANEITRPADISNKGHEVLKRDPVFQRAMGFSSDAQDDAKSIYNAAMKRDYDIIVMDSKKARTADDYYKLIVALRKLPYYPPAKDKIEELKSRSAHLTYGQVKRDYYRTVSRRNADGSTSLIKALEDFDEQLRTARKNRTYFKAYLENDADYDPELERKIEASIEETKEMLYALACRYQDDADYNNPDTNKAKEIFLSLGNYKDSSNRRTALEKAQADFDAKESAYLEGAKAFESKNYSEALELFQKVDDYKDAKERVLLCEQRMKEKKESDAIAAEKRKKITRIIAIVAAVIILAGSGIGIHYYQVKSAEKQAALERQKAEEQAELERQEAERQEALQFTQKSEKMKPAIENALSNSASGISAGRYHTVALKSNGTVVSTEIPDGEFDNDGQTNVNDWTDIVAISAGYERTLGLKSDGTVVGVGDDDNDSPWIDASWQQEVNSWTDIVAISAASYYTVGLKSNGTVVADSDDNAGSKKVSDWTDIVAIATGDDHTVGLKSDGTVVSTNGDGSDWTYIKAISAGSDYTVGLKTDGTVVSTNGDGSDWTDIVAISAGLHHTVGLKSDGTVVSTAGDYGQGDVGDWKDIVAISAGPYHTVGLKSDGTVISTKIKIPDNAEESEKIDLGQTKVKKWKDIVNKGYAYRSRCESLSDGSEVEDEEALDDEDEDWDEDEDEDYDYGGSSNSNSSSSDDHEYDDWDTDDNGTADWHDVDTDDDGEISSDEMNDYLKDWETEMNGYK